MTTASTMMSGPVSASAFGCPAFVDGCVTAMSSPAMRPGRSGAMLLGTCPCRVPGLARSCNHSTIQLTISRRMDTFTHMVEDQNLDDVFHALADPTRRAMLKSLSQSRHTVGELAEPFAISL